MILDSFVESIVNYTFNCAINLFSFDHDMLINVVVQAYATSYSPWYSNENFHNENYCLTSEALGHEDVDKGLYYMSVRSPIAVLEKCLYYRGCEFLHQ